MTPAMDSGLTHREKSAFGIAERFAGVSMSPGRTQFAVIPDSRSSAAMLSVRLTTADFDAL